VLAHPVAAADVDKVAVMKHPVDQRRRHDLIPKNGASFLEAFVGGKDGAGVLIAAADELE
jgi:hypothetical protein